MKAKTGNFCIHSYLGKIQMKAKTGNLSNNRKFLSCHPRWWYSFVFRKNPNESKIRKFLYSFVFRKNPNESKIRKLKWIN